ncbi:Ent-kaurene oxidase [Daldinia childiae]|uniref:Ent-kaurene oxidase n=1 Tax=Daldinia childiae TaxID=326645 RepID=UPI001445D3F7|nr:Ent-kaurene oxidase [Daldinia childiae]KAF3068388.1 Ent-kaurene oxidase [Daldinia childiae]
MDVAASFLEERGPVLASVAVIVTSVFLATVLLGGGNSKLPLVGLEYGSASKRRQAFVTRGLEFYKKGYDLFKSTTAFRVTTLDGDRIVLPRRLMEEVRHLPDDVISLDKAFDVTNEHHRLGIGRPQVSSLVMNVVRGDLTRSLVRINPRLSAETERTIREELPPCEDWTSVVVYQTVLRMVATISGALFIGPELCRSDEYLQASIGYTLDYVNGIQGLKKWNQWLRWVGRYFTPEVTKLFEDRKKAHAFLQPVLEKRRAAMNAGEEVSDDALQWMMKKADEMGFTDEVIAEAQLNLSMAAIHTTSLTVTMILYDLVVRPHIIDELREEIKTVLARHDGVTTSHALFEMKLLDSVMKESQRMNPANLVRFTRYVQKPVTLSDGTHLPAGYLIEAPHALAVMDPELYHNPEEFDAHRFLNLRNGTTEDTLGYKNKEQYQFVTVTKDFMHFGYGRHSCPGRFFAANEIKLILARILLEYDLKMPEGLTERYANINMGTDVLPDPTKEVLFKRVKTTV